MDGIIKNILNNICNCKCSSKEWGRIESNKDLKDNVINAMSNLNNIEISIDGKDLKYVTKIKEYKGTVYLIKNHNILVCLGNIASS